MKAFIVLAALLMVAAAGISDASAVSEQIDPKKRVGVVERRAQIIRRVFRPHGAAAVRVASCESGLDRHAKNGQYLGLFQMGAAERARYGHGISTKAQAIAARRYWVATGRDWSPWECKP